ncbi:MAG TPA: ketoacyl-ACP synthase III [Thermoanaerobaculia bacterium]|jgi:3-oxoacyl-[acyl-carrier-protein] synthase-3|nr:ketoacyl-ACP synthase III [Thermoanaerobaculia bacterium]
MQRRTIITGTGSYLPSRKVANEEFVNHHFLDPTGQPLPQPGDEVVDKFLRITGIGERRYVTDDLVASDIAALAAEEAFRSSGTDRESLDYLIVAHNFGDIAADNRRSSFVPTLASRAKAKLGIRNPRTIAYDLPFGCPGWLQAVIQADYFLKSGDAQRALVIGAETLSRVSDWHDRDSMIYADGAGAAILEARETDEPIGILAHAARTDASEHAWLLRMETTCCPNGDDDALFLKMDGHKVYEYAVKTVPGVVEECLAKAGLSVAQVDKILIHQANAKMDEAIIKRLLRAHGIDRSVEELAPMTVGWLGNSSVATLPTLLDLLLKEGVDGHGLGAGDLCVFASVGAGMNVNALAYRVP